MKLTVAGIGLAFFFIGIYFLPLGFDAVLWIVLQFTASYWHAITVLYIFSVGFIVIGLGMASRGLPLGGLRFIGNPVFLFFIFVVMIVAVWAILKFPEPSLGLGGG